MWKDSYLIDQSSFERKTVDPAAEVPPWMSCTLDTLLLYSPPVILYHCET